MRALCLALFVLLTPLAAAADTAVGLLHHWHFDNGGVRDTVGAAAGSLPGGAANPTSIAGGVAGSNWRSFDGANDYVDINEFTLPAGSWTVSFRIETSDGGSAPVGGYPGTPQVPVLGDNNNNVGYGLGVHGGVATMFYYSGAWRSFSAATNIADGNPHDVTFVWNSGANTLTVYVDGVADGTTTPLGSLNSAYFDDIGRSYSTGAPNAHYADGSIDDIRVYNGALDAATVASLHQESPLLRHHWSFDGADADDVVNGLDFTLGGGGAAPTFQAGAGAASSGAFDFDGANDFMTHAGNITLPDSEWTVSYWIQTTDVANNDGGYAGTPGVPVLGDIDNDVGFGLGLDSGRPGVWYYSGTWRELLSPDGIADGQPHFVTTTYDTTGNTLTLYVDGISKASDSSFALTNHYFDEFGRSYQTPGTQVYADALIDDIRWYDGALSAAQVAANFSNAADAVDLLDFRVRRAPDGVHIAWTTGSEFRCAQFAVERCDLPCASGTTTVVREPCANSLPGAAYDAVDVTARPGRAYRYALVEYETTGRCVRYGSVDLLPHLAIAEWSATGPLSTYAPDPPRTVSGCHAASVRPSAVAALLCALAWIRRRV